MIHKEVRYDLLESETYFEFLHKEFSKRSAKNKLYSMRAFARDLNLSASRLSDILRGRYGLTAKSASSIASAIKLTESESQFFCALVDAQCAKSQVRKKAALLEVSKIKSQLHYHKLNDDVFALISEWYHFAIVELTNLEKFTLCPITASTFLNITEEQASESIERLLRLGLLQQTLSGLQPSSEFDIIDSDVPSAAIQRFHRQFIQLALGALSNQLPSRREFSSCFLTIKAEDIPNAKKDLDKFRDDFVKKYGSGKSKEHLYGLSYQFFDIQK